MKREMDVAGSGSRPNFGPLITGGTIICVGGLISMTGFLVCGVAIARGIRRWSREMDVPPRELAQRKWAQARSAVDASRAAWQDKGKEAMLSGNAQRS